MNTFLKLLRYNLTPVKKGRWVFTSFRGHYSDNPKAISEKLHDLAPEIEIVWLVEERFLSLLPSYVTGVEIHTKAAEKYRASAQVLVDNVYAERACPLQGKGFATRLKAGLLSFFYKTKSKKQKVFTTWHGTPLKRMGKDQIGSTASGFVGQKTVGLMGNRFTAEIIEGITYGKIKTVLTGSPRNDCLLVDEDKAKIKKNLGLPTDKKLVLFAPTFRNDGKDLHEQNIERSGLGQLQAIDFERLFATLKEKFGGEFALVCRFHYHVENAVDWAALEKLSGGRIFNGNLHDDMAAYLACADVLITDASSSMFDFALTKRPCFLFFPDLTYYEEKERGFYLPITTLPFPVSENFETLLQTITSFSKEEYLNGLVSLEKDLGYAEDGSAAENAVKYILERTGE
ncbi:MAG: hypothetical protein E7380_06320 [Clostridiales bacterium]|nr:hypothetical protein [Clostridiales bacterium]